MIRVPKAISQYRINRLTQYFTGLLETGKPIKVLDVGCGHAHITREIQKTHPQLSFTGVDVVVRPDSAIEVIQYDGKTLPFADKSFDVVFLIDVLHHADDPVGVLKECARVAKDFILLKDHISDSSYDQVRLEFMDWFGNRPFGIPMTYKYFTSAQWKDAFKEAGLEPEKLLRKIQTCPPPVQYLLDYDVHLIAKLRPVN